LRIVASSRDIVCISQINRHRFILDKPSSIHGKIHYTTSNEIGLKLRYPLDIVESIRITYKIQQNEILNEINLSPPLLNVRLTNLSCGNIYEIMIYANNQVGTSLNEYLTGKTDGSSKNSILRFTQKIN
jgi:hypothetical protein